MHPSAAVNRVTLLRSVAQAKQGSPCYRCVDRLQTAAAGVLLGRCCQRHEQLPFVAACLVGLNLGRQLRQCAAR
jgi:hypothetical protein